MKKRSELLWLLKKIRRFIPALMLVTGISALNAYLGVRFAMETQQVIDSIAGGGNAFRSACIRLAAVSTGLILCYALIRHFRDQTTILMDAHWKKQMTHVLLAAEYKKISAYHSGELVNRLNNDVRVVDDTLIAVFPGVVSMVIRLAAAVYALVRYESRFTIVVLFAGCMVALFTAFMKRFVKNLHRRVNEENGRVLGFLQEIMEKLLVVQAMDMTDEAERRTESLLHRRWLVQRRLKNVSMLGNTFLICACYIAEFAAVVFCSYQLMSQAMTLGSMTAIIQLVSQLEGPFIYFSGSLSQLISIFASVERLMELDEMDQVEQEAMDPDPLYAKMTAIELRDVTFGYDDAMVMDRVNICIPKGSFVVVTGESGAGKSTLLKLLLGIYEANSGSITLETAESEILLNRKCRRLFAYVPQGNLLLSGTLRENLLMAAPEAGEKELLRALEISCLKPVVEQLPDGMDTMLGESGMGLSEGQAQRLSIARAILRNAPILLLDEATSALDTEIEKRVLENISRIPNRTFVVVTHRPAALELADIVIHVHDGIMHIKKNA